MTPRMRRLLGLAIALVALLFAGRWLVGLLADRWWAGAISADARDAVTRWHLLGLLLDAGATLIASAWFATNAMLVARAIGSVQVEHQLGELRVREAVPLRLLLVGAVATGVLLGLLTGVGARAWRAPVALAWEGVHYGIADPLLGVDLGVLVGQYPVWHLAQRYGALLVVLGLVFVAILYLAIGAVRREGGRIAMHADARRHIGALLAIAALVIAAGYFLGPYRIATARMAPIAGTAASVQVLACYAAAGAAIAVAMISLRWALHPRHSLIAGGWAVMALVAVAERWVVPAFAAESTTIPGRDAAIRLQEQVFYAIPALDSVSVDPDGASAVATIWDEGALGDWVRARGGVLLAATPHGRGFDSLARWTTASHFHGDPGSLEFRQVPAGRVAPGGSPPATAGVLLRDPLAWPGAPRWRVVGANAGVAAGHVGRRVAMAWALQAPGVLSLQSGGRVGWDHDPTDRAARLVPGLQWQTLGVTDLNGDPMWIVAGIATVARAPLTARIALGRREVAGAVPALVAVVRAADGAVRLYQDPAADSLGAAWARVAGAMVAPASELPAAVRRDLPYDPRLLDAQLRVIEQPHWSLGRRDPDPLGTPDPPATLWTTGGPARQVVLRDPASREPLSVVSAGRVDGVPRIQVAGILGLGMPPAETLDRSWHRMLGLAQLRDSVRAAGDTALAGPIRHRLVAGTVEAWRSYRSAGRQGDPALLWVATARGPLIGGGRSPAEAWSSLGQADSGARPVTSFDLAARMEAVRGWISRADSALLRGDLTAFARAWEAIRGLLLQPPSE
jgi:hypothetical protein